MPFNPHVQDRRGEMTMQAMGQIADLNYSGAVAGAQGMARGIEAGGQALAGAGMQFLETLAKQRNNLGKMEALASYFPGEQLDGLAKIKDPDKLAGALAVAEDGVRAMQRQGLLEREYELRAGMAAAEQAANRTGSTTVLVDPVTGTKVGGFYQNNNQVVPFDVDAGNGPAGATKVDLGGGAYAYMDNRGKPIPTSAIREPEVNPMTDMRRSQLQSEVARLAGQVKERGEDAVNGPNWNPWATTLGNQLEGARAELKELGGSEGAPLDTPDLSGGGGYGSAADVRAAYQAGTLSAEQASQILRQKFGMR